MSGAVSGAMMGRLALGRNRDLGAIDVVGELRVARRQHRLESIHWIDALYRLYVLIIIGAGLTWLAASLVAERPAGAVVARQVAARAPVAIGWFVTVVSVLALRSGARGGPLAVEAADVVHLLQSPVDRGSVLRRPLVHVLRRAVLIGLGVGAAFGRIADRALGRNGGGWIFSGAACGVLLGVWAVSLAAVVSGRRLKRMVVFMLGVVLIGWMTLDTLARVRTSPMTLLGAAVASPLRGVHPGPLLAWPIPAFLSIGLLVVALFGMGNVSIEKAQRRAGLVAQLRFAVSTQDLRTALLLRRQLASERPRPRPWFRVPSWLHHRGSPDAAVFTRGIQGLARWPLARVIRVSILAAAAGAVGRLAWERAIPLVLLVGMIGYVVGLDAVEALAQDADHADLVRRLPRHAGRLANRQLIVPVLALLLCAPFAIAGATGVGFALGRGWGGPRALVLTLVTVVLGAVGSCAGAALSIVLGPPSFQLMLQTPEAAFAYTGLGPLVATIVTSGPLVGAYIARYAAHAAAAPGKAAVATAGARAAEDVLSRMVRGASFGGAVAAVVAYGALLAVTDKGVVRKG